MTSGLKIRAEMFQAIMVSALIWPCASQTSGSTSPVTTATQTVEVTETYGSGSDLVADLQGTTDTVNGGKAGYQDNVITFNPPAGYQVRILSATGTISTFARDPIPAGKHAGLSWGLVASPATPSGRADLINDVCMSYIKQSLSGNKDTDTTWFDFTRIANGVLGPDNKLISRSAVYLNEGGMIHIEISLLLSYRFEKIGTP